MSSTKKQIILIALSVLLVVLFLFMPEKPASVSDKTPVQEEVKKDITPNSHSSVSVDDRIKSAIEKVKGAAPMAGILELKSIADEDPSQLDAQYFLGISSIQIGELEKAVNRFEKVITFAGLKKYPDARLKLSECFMGLGLTDKAIEQLELEVRDENSSLKSQAKEQLDRIRN